MTGGEKLQQELDKALRFKDVAVQLMSILLTFRDFPGTLEDETVREFCRRKIIQVEESLA